MLIVKMKVVEVSLKNAREWEKKGQAPWVERCMATALMNYLSISVCDHDERHGLSWLKAQGVNDHLDHYVRTLSLLVEAVDAGKVPSSVIGGNYNFLVFCHLSWLLADFENGAFLARVAVRADVIELSSPFWREYGKAIEALVAGKTYSPPSLEKLRGLEKYWRPYLDLVEAVSTGQEIEQSLSAVEQSFVARNADRGIKDDNYQIEGSALCPVRWDFRRTSLVSFITRWRQS